MRFPAIRARQARPRRIVVERFAVAAPFIPVFRDRLVGFKCGLARIRAIDARNARFYAKLPPASLPHARVAPAPAATLLLAAFIVYEVGVLVLAPQRPLLVSAQTIPIARPKPRIEIAQTAFKPLCTRFFRTIYFKLFKFFKYERFSTDPRSLNSENKFKLLFPRVTICNL